MTRRLGVVFVALSLVAAGCGDDDDDEGAQPAGGDAPAGAQTVEVGVDANTDAFNGSFRSYFPSEVTVRPGDTVDFTSVFTGEPHSVTMGTLVDSGLPKALADLEAEEEPEELAKIPHMLPEDEGDAIQAAAQPCFRKAGDPPAEEACPRDEQQQPEFDGTYAYYNSGFLPDGAEFKLKLADSIQPGTYSFFCNLHRAGMNGSIKVVAEGQSVPSADEVQTAGTRQLDETVSKLRAAAQSLRQGTLPPFITEAEPGTVIAGGGSEEVQEASINEFGPKDVSIKVNEPVTWTIIGAHSITFNSTEALRTFIAKAPDGSVHLNPESFAPVGGPGQPPPPEEEGPPPGGEEDREEPSGPPPPPTVVDGGSWDGAGLRSSGIFFSFPGEGFFAYKLTFTKAGTYPYACTIHPDMTGTVKVA